MNNILENIIILIDCNKSEYYIYNTLFGHYVGYSREIFYVKN